MIISNIFILSYALTYWYQLSTIFDGPPFLSRKELHFGIIPLEPLFYTCNLHKTIETYMSYYAKLQHTHEKQRNSIPNCSFLERKGAYPPRRMGDSWFLYVNRKEWRVYDISFPLVTRLLNSQTCFSPFIISTILFRRSLVTGWVLWRRWERVMLSVAPLLKTSRAR